MSDMTGQKERWHLDKRFPIALILAFVMQTFAAGWWASSIEGRVSNTEASIAAQGAELSAQRQDVRDQAIATGRIEEKITAVRSDISRVLSILERESGR
jgi:hypothetical protein